MSGFKEYAGKICMCLIVLLVMAGLHLHCPEFQMTFEMTNQTYPSTKFDLTDTNIDKTALYTEEVGSLRAANVVAKKLASTIKNRRMERLSADLSIPTLLLEKIPYYIEMKQRLAELPTNRRGLLLQYVHDKDGKKREQLHK